MTTTVAHQNDESKTSPKKRAKGLFPRLSFGKALELSEALYKLGHGEPVRRRTVYDDLGKSPDSGHSRNQIIAANSGYGLIKGTYTAEYLELTELGKRIANSKNESQKRTAIQDAILQNEMAQAFVNYFHDKPLPIDEIAIDYFRKNFKLEIEDAKSFWEVLKSNMNEYGFVQQLSGKSILVNPNVTPENSNYLEDIVIPDEKNLGQSTESSANETAIKRGNGIPRSYGDIIPQFNFNIQIVLPENASSKVYDDIFKSISTHLLKRNNEE